MKKAFFLVVCFFALQIQTQAQSTNITTRQWQEDLNFLQETVHKDYSFLFKKTTTEVFDAEVIKLRSQIPTMEDHEIVIGLARIISLFKYGHTAVRFRYQQLPINLYHFNDGVFIQGVHKNYAQALGTKVIAINNMVIEDALKAIYPAVPAENDQFFKAYGLNYLRTPEILHAQGIIDHLSSEVEFTLEKDGTTFKQKFKTLQEGERVPANYGYIKEDDNWLSTLNNELTPNYLKQLNKIYYFEYLAEHKALYVRHSQIQDEPDEDIPTFYKRVFDFIENNDVERLIIDVRLNGGGNNFKNKPIIQGLIRSEKLQKKGSLYVIIGRRTFSACQNLVNEIDNYTNAIFLGEPTAENINFYGDNNRIELPHSKTPVFLSFAWWQDKPQWQGGPWTAPHIAIDLSSSDFIKGKDPVLETALTFDGSSFIIDPMQHLTDLFMAGKTEQIARDAKAMVNNPMYQFFDFESNLNQAGYKIMRQGQMEPAIFIFQLITELYPDSANAWDSLAEGHLKAGNKEKAITYYNKALSMDPNGNTGKNSKAMLAKIKSSAHK